MDGDPLQGYREPNGWVVVEGPRVQTTLECGRAMELVPMGPLSEKMHGSSQSGHKRGVPAFFLGEPEALEWDCLWDLGNAGTGMLGR